MAGTLASPATCSMLGIRVQSLFTSLDLPLGAQAWPYGISCRTEC